MSSPSVQTEPSELLQICSRRPPLRAVRLGHACLMPRQSASHLLADGPPVLHHYAVDLVAAAALAAARVAAHAAARVAARAAARVAARTAAHAAAVVGTAERRLPVHLSWSQGAGWLTLPDQFSSCLQVVVGLKSQQAAPFCCFAHGLEAYLTWTQSQLRPLADCLPSALPLSLAFCDVWKYLLV